MSASQPFDGIRVVEFGQFVAVPFCGQVLAEGGAEVIKVESPAGDPNRRMGEIVPGESRIFISRNRGKHSLPLKLRDDGARAVVERLLAWADVVLMNFRPGHAGEIGLAPDRLLEAYPRLVIGDITPFGKQGPDANLSAMDIVVQARSGLMAAMGRTIDGRPAPGEPVISDYMAAMTLAFGVSSALFRRERTGRGGIVDVTLMKSAMTLANNQLTRSEGLDREVHRKRIERLNEQRRAGASFEEQAGTSPTARVLPLRTIYFRTYETADAAVAIACASKGLQVKFMQALGLEDKSHETDDITALGNEYFEALRRRVETVMRSRPAKDWVETLNEAGVPVSTVKFPIEMFEDDQAAANEMFHILEHPSAGQFRVLSPPLSLDGDGFRPGNATPPFGTETRAILGRLGFSDDEITRLAELGVTRLSDQPSG